MTKWHMLSNKRVFSNSKQRPESVLTVEPQLPLCGAGMVQATTCVTPVDCTTRWTAKTDHWSDPRRDWYDPLTYTVTHFSWVASQFVLYSTNNKLLQKMISFLCFRLSASGPAHCVPTVTPARQHCGDATPTESLCVTPVDSISNCTMWVSRNYIPGKSPRAAVQHYYKKLISVFS